MKTLKQIILEGRGASGEGYSELSAKKLVQTLYKSNDDDLAEIFEKRDGEYQAYIFTPPKNGKMKVGGQKLQPIKDSGGNDYNNVQQDFGIAFEDTLKNKLPGASRVILLQPWKKKQWLVILLQPDFTDMGMLKRKLTSSDKVTSTNKYTYYKLSSLITRMAAVDLNQKDDADKADAIAKNNEKWMKWIPISSVDLSIKDKHGEFVTEKYAGYISKIRQIVGLKPGEKFVFDKELETVLKAWQKKRIPQIPVTGVWDNASEEAVENLLTDPRFYRSYDDLDDVLAAITALTPTEIKNALGTEETETEEETEEETEKTELATDYRIWANSSEELQKLYGKSSKFKLDPESTTPANSYFDKSYKKGQTAYDARDKTKTYTVYTPIIIPKDNNGQTDPSLIN